MTQNYREELHRAIGIIEGVSFNVSDRVANALERAVEILEDILDKEAKESEDKNAKAEF